MKRINKNGGALSQKFADFIVKYRWFFIALYIVATVVACVFIFKINVTYDLSGYLPKSSSANQAMQLLKEEFDDKGMTYVMVAGITPERATEISGELSGIDGVANVVYVKEQHYLQSEDDASVGNALFTVNLKDYDSTDGCFATIDEIIEILKDEESYLTGQSAFSYFTKLETFKSIYTIGIVIVIAILLMILLTSRTYFEIVIVVIVLATAVVTNMGTNAFFDKISYVSNMVALVLQLALSIDYSVILLHRYMEEFEIVGDAKTATSVALKKSIPEILSSSLTTIAGLCSLMLMALPIGVELGIALAKSIVFSLLSVILLMPGLLVLCSKLIEKSKHKSFIPNVTRPARAIVRARMVIVPVFLIIIVLSCVGQFNNKYSFNMNGGSMIVEPQEKIKEGGFGTLNSLVIVVPNEDYDKQRELVEYVSGFEIIDSSNALSSIEFNGLYLTDSFTKDELISTLLALADGDMIYEELIDTFGSGLFDKYVQSQGITEENPEVRLVDLLVFACNDEDYSQTLRIILGEDFAMLKQLVFAKDNLESENYSRMIFNINSGTESDDTFALISELKKGIPDYFEEYYMTGESVVCYDMAEFFPKDNLVVSLCTIGFVLLILLLTFKNLALPLILALAIQGGIWINFVIPYLSQNPISFIGYLMICAIQMGATIDYAIVLTNRYLDVRKDYTNRYDAMAAAENAVFPTIITSGVILTITGFTLGLAASGVVAKMGMLLGIGTLTSMLIVLFILPSLLLVTERLFDKANFNTLFKRKRQVFDTECTVGEVDCEVGTVECEREADASEIETTDNEANS